MAQLQLSRKHGKMKSNNRVAGIYFPIVEHGLM
jgi:hypothetical protein